MKVFSLITLTALWIIAVGCSNDKVAAPAGNEEMNYDVIGEDTPESFEMAMQELAELSISVPDPVADSDPRVCNGMDPEEGIGIINSSALDDEGRVNFRRILAHLHHRMERLRGCMAENPDPRLRRLAHGASQAVEMGLRALQNGEPRRALHSFHEANRMLNLAAAICRGGRG